jgi:peptidoglycan/LPS O-acetylase OafA/YrhL
MTLVSFGMKPLTSVENPLNMTAHSFWWSMHRIGWASSIAWIIFACQNGSGGIFKWFLELPVWQPFGRISLSFYLLQTVYQTVLVGAIKTPTHFNPGSLVSERKC